MVASVLDTSVLIAVLDSGETIPAIQEAIAAGSALLPPLVVAELVTGATNLGQREKVGILLQEVGVCGTPLDHWINAGLLRQQLSRKGLNVTLPDAHIAQCAIERDASLISRDAIFAKIARHTKLRVITA